MTEHLIRCDWEAGGRGPGIHGIRVDVTADELCRQTITREVTAVRQVPRPEVRREATRHDRYFEIALTVENRGDGGCLLSSIDDQVAGFQPIMKDDPASSYEVTADCGPHGKACAVRIRTRHFRQKGDRAGHRDPACAEPHLPARHPPKELKP